MHGVDEEKIPPHETVRTIDRIESAPGDAFPRVETPPCTQASALQFLAAHAARDERDLVVAVAVVEPPGVVAQAPFLREAMIKWRAGKGGEVIEGGDVEGV